MRELPLVLVTAVVLASGCQHNQQADERPPPLPQPAQIPAHVEARIREAILLHLGRSDIAHIGGAWHPTQPYDDVSVFFKGIPLRSNLLKRESVRLRYFHRVNGGRTLDVPPTWHDCGDFFLIPGSGVSHLFIDEHLWRPRVVEVHFEMTDDEFAAARQFIDSRDIRLHWGSTQAVVRSADITGISKSPRGSRYSVSTRYPAGESIKIDLDAGSHRVLYR